MESALLKALKARFKRPADCLIALGLSPALLAMDSKFENGEKVMPRLSSRTAIRASGAIIGYVGPRLAKDAKFDPAIALEGVTAKNFKSSIPKIVETVKRQTTGRLAHDADPQDLQAVLESVGNQGDDLTDALDATTDLNSVVAGLKAGDADLWELMRSRLSDEDFAKLREMILAEPDMDRPATDDPPDFPGMPRTGGGMVPLASDAALSNSLVETFGARAALGLARTRVLPMENATRPTRAQRVAFASGGDGGAAASFAAMFPNAGKARVL